MIPTRRESQEPVNISIQCINDATGYGHAASFKVFHGQNVRVRAKNTNTQAIRVATSLAALSDGGTYEELAAGTEVYFPVTDTGTICTKGGAGEGVQVTIKGTV